ncbi:MAG: protein kinase [Pyrinomonadaceae bacterium]
MFAGTHFGRYEIRSKIGEGGMGEVYSARDIELDRDVAIKLLPNEFMSDDDRRGRFRQEARVVSAINHPNIITIYEIGENEHGSFLATEFVEGRTLREIMRNESITLPRILKIIEQSANALVAAHAAGIIHRDIKPENIMVRSDSIVKVLDFGLAKPLIPAGALENDPSNKTVPGTVMGSARYMSPEQARGREVDERTDIWSLGVVLYEMLSGNPPFDGESTADTIASVVYKEPLALSLILPNVPLELQRIIRKALQKDREERYQNVKDFALDIKDLLYALEHANSGERAAQVISDPAFTENPTMIHQTVSGNHPTGLNTAAVSSPQHSFIESRTAYLIPAGAALLIAFLSVVGVGAYYFLAGSERLAETAFVKPHISRVSTDGRVMQPAISPDGKYIAYVSGEFGSRSLVVRQVATDSVITLVPPTNLNLQSVTFTPSGDYVYYTQTSPDATVSTLYQVPALGGTPKLVVEDVDSPPAFTPDGKQFAFIRRVPKSNEDHIILVNSETLEQARFLATTATNYDFFVMRLAFSPDGQRLLVGAGTRQSGFINKTDIVEVGMKDRSLRPLNRREFLSVSNFAWLSDGSGYVFTARQTLNDPVQIWMASYATGDLHQITNDLNDYVDLGISADGRTMVTIKGDPTGSIWRYGISDKASTQLTSDGRNTEGRSGLLQLPDGSIVFSRNEGRTAQLWASDADGRNPRPLFEENGFAVDPVLSADGRTIVFNLQKDRRSRIWKMNADGSNAVPISEDNPDFADFSPQVTADGRWVIFQRQVANEERYRLMRIPIEGGRSEVFYEDPARGVFHPRLSQDGKRIAFASYDLVTFGKQLHIATLDGPAFGKIEQTVDFNLINGFVWAPDSRELTILSNRNGALNLWRQPIDGSPAKQITDYKAGRIFNFRWSNDGRSMLLARGTVNNDLILIRDVDPSDPASEASAKRKPRTLRRQSI